MSVCICIDKYVCTLNHDYMFYLCTMSGDCFVLIYKKNKVKHSNNLPPFLLYVTVTYQHSLSLSDKFLDKKEKDHTNC